MWEAGTIEFTMPTRIRYGVGILNELPKEIQRLGVSHPFLVGDPGIVQAGLLQFCQQPLEEAGIPYTVFTDVPVDPSAKVVDEAVAQARRASCDGVIAIGGGSTLLAAKGMALMLANEGHHLRDFEGVENLKNPPVPVIAIPTTAGSGAEVSPAIPITDEQVNKKISVRGYRIHPEVAMLDPRTVATLPARQFIASGIDALAHTIESFCTVRSNPLTDAIALDAMGRIFRALPAAALTGDMAAKGEQLFAATMANIACGNAGLGLVHGSNKAIYAICRRTGRPWVPHGVLNGIMLPYVMEFNLPVCQEKFARMAQHAMGEPAEGCSQAELARKAVNNVKRLLSLLDFPRRLPWDGVTDEELEQMADLALIGAQTKQNPRRPSRGELIELFRRSVTGWSLPEEQSSRRKNI